MLWRRVKMNYIYKFNYPMMGTVNLALTTKAPISLAESKLYIKQWCDDNFAFEKYVDLKCFDENGIEIVLK